MKFIITRASLIQRAIKPCEEAVKDKATKIMALSCPYTLEEAKKNKYLKGFFDKTKNIRKEGHLFVGESKDKVDVWVININTLEELIEFSNKHGTVAILKSEYKEIPYNIEIIDVDEW